VKRTIAFCVTSLGLILSLSACTNPYDPAQRFVGGGLLGAGAGAAIGAAAGGGPGAALGAAIGGATGAIGASSDHDPTRSHMSPTADGLANLQETSTIYFGANLPSAQQSVARRSPESSRQRKSSSSSAPRPALAQVGGGLGGKVATKLSPGRLDEAFDAIKQTVVSRSSF
jgi:hypothetical protein